MGKIFDVIKWDDPSALSNDIIVYKHEAEDFNTESQIIVHQNQTAVFFANGKSLDVLPAGRYSLRTSNLPGLRRYIESAFGGQSIFHCEVYFINHVRKPDIDWGFADGQSATINFRGQMYPIEFTACGTYGIHLDYGEDGTNIGKFLEYLVGTQCDFSKEDVDAKITGEFLQAVKDKLSNEIGEQDVAQVLNIGRHYKTISASILADMAPVFEERYGIYLDLIAFEKIKISKDSYDTIVSVQKRAVEAGIKYEESVVGTQAEAFKGKTDAEVEAYRRQVGGYTYQQESQREILSNAAQNEGTAGTFMGAGMGLGMGMGLGGAFGAGMANVSQGMMNGVQQQVNQPQAGATCPDCGAQLPAGAKFCGNCGKKLGNFCPDCGAELMAGAKFCGNCGKKLVAVCPSCGTELAPGTKFCGNCGQKI